MTESSAGSKPAKSELTKKRIMETYLAIVPCKKWDKITVKEICAGANITRGTFYQYYSDIYDLMEQIENALIDDLTEKYHAIVKHPKTFYPPERFEEKFDYSPPRFLNVWFEFCRNNRKAMAVLLDPQNGEPVEIFMTKMMKPCTPEEYEAMSVEEREHAKIQPPMNRRVYSPEDGIICMQDVPVKMRDGVTIYADIYKPEEEGKYPLVISWSFYGKRPFCRHFR
jgi:AcrR family transcriptional regulator